ncbi:hypothetical protein Trydic_g17736 [Trypoxylus dichotomus]
MPKSSSNVPSHTSQITFKNEDDVYHVNDPPPASRSTSRGSKDSKTSASGSKTSAKGSKSNLKTSKASIKESASRASKGSVKSKSDKSLDREPVTSTPKSSKHKKSVEGIDILAIEGSKQLLQAESGEYTPMPYIFRTPNPNSSREVKKVPTKCPPYALQLDHTLAVVWILYSKKEVKRPMGIVQLQWAHNFLRGIYNRRGEHPKDVALCLQQIEDQLIEQYAGMVDDVQYIKQSGEEPTLTKDKVEGKGKSKTADKSKNKGKGKKSTFKTKDSHSESEVADVEHEEIEIEGGVGEEGGTGGPEDENGGDVETTAEDEKNENCEDHVCTNKVCTEPEEKEDIILQQVPFSINYAEMMSRSPPVFEELYPCCKSSKTSSVGSTARRSTSGIGTSVSHDNMLDFLKAWRREQVEKIQAELKRLKSIENFIGSAEADNFSPYLDEKQLDALVAQKVNSPNPKSKGRTKQ